jgi:hypothetical protein
MVAEAAHARGKKLAYVMTTGVGALGHRLLEAGVDLLYFYDPFQDNVGVQQIRDLAAAGMTIAGGTNTLSLGREHERRLESEVRTSIDVLGPTSKFMLHPVDALFPDTPASGLERLMALRRRYG